MKDLNSDLVPGRKDFLAWRQNHQAVGKDHRPQRARALAAGNGGHHFPIDFK